MAETRAQLDAQENVSRGNETYDTTVRDLDESRDARTYHTDASMSAPGTGASEDPQRLEQEIAQTRREMAGTLNEIQRRLDPDRLKHEAQQRAEEAVERAKDKVEDATIGRVKNMTERATQRASNWRTNVVNTVKENPVPAALVGVGLGWLIMESSNRDQDYDQDRYGRRYDQYAYGGSGYGDFGRSDYMRDRDDQRYYYGERRGGAGQQLQEARREVGERVDEMGRRIEETTGEVRQRAQHLREEAGERIEETTDEIRQRAEHVRDEAEEQWDELREETLMRARQMQYRARTQGRQVKRNVQHLMQENPLAVGAAALALGVLVGWAVPATETESRLVGEYRDDLVDQARHEAQAVARRAQSAAKEAVEDVKEETKHAAKQAAAEVSDESKRAAQRMSDKR